MNARPSSLLRRTLLAAICAVSFAASISYAVNHNPETQPNPGAKTTDVTLSNPRFVTSGEDYTASVEVDGGAYPDLLEQGGPIFVSVYNAETSEVLDAQEVKYAGTFTFTLDASSNCGCKIYFEINGLTDGSAKSGEATLQSGSGHGTSSINSYYDLGHTLSGGSAGQLLIYANRPSANIYTPAGIGLVVSSPSVEVIRVGAGDAVRQVLSATQLTDVVTLSPDSYEIRFYTASQKGAKVAGLYQPTGSPFKVAKIENPGITPIAGTEDDTLYVSARWERNFAYKLPVADGPYRVELQFAELYHDTIGDALFDVKAEGIAVLSDYDVLAAAGSKNTARLEEIQTTVTDGELNLDFSSTVYGAQLAALKVVRDGEVAIAGTSDQTLYQSERTGDFAYALTLPNGTYDVVLHFSESTYAETGKRVFDVTAEGVAVLEDYDIYAEAGATNTAHTATIPVTLADGVLDLAFDGLTGEASLAALTVIDTTTSTVVAAVNAGGSAYTAADSTEFVADIDFTGGQARFPGQVAHAINAGGGAYLADDGTAFAADNGFEGGFTYLGAINRVQITDTEGGSSQVYEYTWVTEPRTGAFEETILTHPGGLKKEGISVVYSQDEQSYVKTRTLRDGLDNLVSKVTEHYERFPFGDRKVSEIVDPDGLALTTTWTYIEGTGNPADPKPDGYGKEKSMDRYDGYWEEYAYDSEGRLVKTTSRYLSSTTRDDADNKVDTIAYATTNPIRTRVTVIQGQETARTYEAEFDDVPNNEFERWTITAVTPGAAWNAADNLVSKTRTYKSAHPTSHLRGQTKWTRSPNGTMTIYTYAMSGDDRVVTRDNGEPNGSGTAIVAGTRTITTTNPERQQIAEEVIDIPSGLTLSDWEALTVDSLGRPTLIGYGDGTTRSVAYVGSAASCGSCSGSGNFLIESETDRNGVTTYYDYDALNRRTDTTRLGVTETVVYDPMGRVVEQLRTGTSGPAISQKKTTYDLAGRVVATEDALGNVTDYDYTYPTGGGMVTTITQPAATTGAERGTRIETAYADGRTKEISGTAISPLKYIYGTWSASGQAGEWTQQITVGESASETEWTKTYTDLARRTVKMEYADSVVATMAYNTLGQLVSQTDPDGVRTLYAYNAEGEREVTAIDMDQDGVIDYAGLDRITKTVRDVYSRSGTIVNRTTTQVWATDNANTATTVSVSEQDGYGNQSWRMDSAGAIASTATARTSAGAWTVTSTAPDGSQQVQTYTGGRLTSTTRKNNTGGQVTLTSYAYDAHNRVATQTDARTGDTTYTYTDRDEVLTVTTNNGTETTAYAYDALGNQLTITRPDSSVTTNEYHLRNNQLKKTYGSLTYPVEYTYDPQGRMKTLTTWQNAATSAGAAVTTWNYDSQRGWLSEKLYDDDTGPAYSYTDAGRLETRTWARTVSSAALVTTYGYDNAGQLTSTDYSDTTPDVSITYTRFGAQKTVTDATGERTFAYDPVTLRLQSEALPSAYYGDRILTRSYQVGLDLVSTPPSVPGRPDGFSLGTTSDPDSDYDVVYAYDTAGRLKTVTDLNGSHTYGYLANSPLRETLTSPVHTTTTTYEPYRNVVANVENKVGTTIISNYGYTVNELGQRTARTNTGTAFSTTSTDNFTYNAKGEVTGSTNATIPAYDQTYSYDDIGNRTSSSAGILPAVSYSANGLNQYTAIGAASPTHDLDGNQLTTGTGQVYTWDAENRLISVEPAMPLTGDKRQVNTYDGQSRRVRKQVYTYTGSAWSLVTDEKFIYDGWNVVAKLLWNPSTSTFDLNSTFTWGVDLSGSLQGAGGVGGLLATSEINSGTISATYHYTYDANGNVSEVLNSSGGIAAHYEYDAFGNTVASSGTYAAVNAYRFSTKPLDSVGELYYYGFRYYNPNTGRWPSRDPIGEKGAILRFSPFWSDLKAGDINDYCFVSNNGLDYYDFLGLACGSGWNELLVPDSPQGFDFSSACAAHDACYGCSGKKNGKDKPACDNDFLSAMESVCMSLPDVGERQIKHPSRRGNTTVPDNPRKRCLGVAKTYYNAVVAHGAEPFRKARKCCP